MFRRFCDLCDTEIQGNMYRVLRMITPDGKIPTTDGNSDIDTYVPEIDVCPACASSIMHTIKGIISGGAEDPTYEVSRDG